MVNFAELALTDEVANLADRGVIEESMIDKQHRALIAAKPNKLASLFHVKGQGLFYPHMLAGSKGLARQ